MTKRQAYVVMLLLALLTCTVLCGAGLMLHHVAEATTLIAGCHNPEHADAAPDRFLRTGWGSIFWIPHHETAGRCRFCAPGFSGEMKRCCLLWFFRIHLRQHPFDDLRNSDPGWSEALPSGPGSEWRRDGACRPRSPQIALLPPPRQRPSWRN